MLEASCAISMRGSGPWPFIAASSACLNASTACCTDPGSKEQKGQPLSLHFSWAATAACTTCSVEEHMVDAACVSNSTCVIMSKISSSTQCPTYLLSIQLWNNLEHDTRANCSPFGQCGIRQRLAVLAVILHLAGCITRIVPWCICCRSSKAHSMSPELMQKGCQQHLQPTPLQWVLNSVTAGPAVALI